MTQNDKKLLFKDLCARLPYGVIVKYKSQEGEGDVQLGCGNIGYVLQLGNGWWKECKPYLRPMESMTEEERIEFSKLFYKWHDDELFDYIEEGAEFSIWKHKGISAVVFDWLNKKGFDYRGLIPMGLAIAVTEENNPYNKKY